MSKNGQLTPKQQRFVEEYLIDLNATAAYKRAGYSCSAAAAIVSASRLLTNDNVQQFIQDSIKKRSESTEITSDYVLKTIKSTVERCKNPDGKEKFDPGSVLKGAELLGKHLKMFSEQIKHDHSGSITIVMDDTDAKL